MGGTAAIFVLSTVPALLLKTVAEIRGTKQSRAGLQTSTWRNWI